VPASIDEAIREVERRTVDGASLLERMAHHRVPGAAVALIAGGALAWEGSYGVKDTGGDDLVTPETLFQACSISKPVAVLGLLRLVERGALDLDADVNDVLTSWRVAPNASWQPRVTLRQIASHSAGLTVSGFPGYAAGAPLPTLTEILTGAAPANTPGIRVDTVPGLEFRYAGGGTTVLQQVMEDATGTPFAALMQDLVLGPSGMARSAYAQPLPADRHVEAATAHRSDGTPVPGRWHVYPELAAAGLWTTPGDLARFAIAVQRAAAGAPDAILGPGPTTAMLTPHVESTARLGGLRAVGLGLFLGAPDPAWFGHSGGNEGFRCHLLAHRNAGCGAVVMTNGDRGHALVAEVLDALARELDWPGYPASASEDEQAEAELDDFIGRYVLRPGAEIVVARAGDDLEVSAPGQAPIRFLRTSDTTFGSLAVETTLEFAPGEVVLGQNGGEHRCPRVAGGGTRYT
jgi:CubicO group peptidase (beta-lactamase class C family)